MEYLRLGVPHGDTVTENLLPVPVVLRMSSTQVCDAIHACCLGRIDPGPRVLDDNASLGLHAHLVGGVEE